MTGESAEQVADRIAPHQTTVRAQLAVATFSRGATAILSGNRSAQQGDWTAAEQRWQAALEANPQSAAALYNLGLAHEARQDFAQAQELYAAAVQVTENPLYAAARQRVERAQREHQTALAQMQRLASGNLVAQVPAGLSGFDGGRAQPWGASPVPAYPQALASQPPGPVQTSSYQPQLPRVPLPWPPGEPGPSLPPRGNY